MTSSQSTTRLLGIILIFVIAAKIILGGASGRVRELLKPLFMEVC